MKLTDEQIEFLDKVCFGRHHKWKLNSDGEVDVDGDVIITSLSWRYIREINEIPVKFGTVKGYFNCSGNNLTTLKNCPTSVGEFYCYNNNLTDYFKSIKEDEFPLWSKLHWGEILKEYPFLINIVKKYKIVDALKIYLHHYPLTKLYLE